MPNFNVTVKAYALFSYEIEAESVDEAEEKAVDRAGEEPSLVKGHETDGTEFELEIAESDDE